MMNTEMSIKKQGNASGKFKLACQQIVAGGTAGFVEVSLMQPLDLIKTRFQIQSIHTEQYSSIGDCIKKIYQNEGILSFYKGILPPILADVPKRATKFFTFEQYKQLFSFGAPSPTALSFTLAGLASGVTEGFLINPFEVVKVRLQAENQVFSKQISAWSMAKVIVHENGFGLSGLNKGLTSTLFRHGIFNMIYFSFYHNIKGYMKPYQDKKLEFLRKFMIGLTGGSIASCINIPFDVAKSRIQGPQPTAGHIKYKTCLRTIHTVYVEEGVKALYKGLLPKMLRLGPGGAIMLLVNEHVLDWLQNNT
ncbi:mitochondrial 2-oxodicarboxylate carrier-like [Antedon mediterranea]|uniref:mitochondrial 2-oxodicarboxylate carrier-like n=1 Tax=Antedon mediterranea TaxID=105859 RepID=UPI003AF6DA6E